MPFMVQLVLHTNTIYKFTLADFTTRAWPMGLSPIGINGLESKCWPVKQLNCLISFK